MHVQAFAKINIGIQIVRRRGDGYHDIDTIFHRVNIADELEFTRRERGITISTNDITLPVDDSNLCILAAKSLFELLGYDAGVHIDLLKVIPYGAGLGGGSADAAATLLALQHHLELEIGTDRLLHLARQIGADVPYFLKPGTAYAQGIGDELTYFHFDFPGWIVIVSPGIHVSTPWAYREINLDNLLPIVNLRETLFAEASAPENWTQNIRNDFEDPVFNAHPELRLLKNDFIRHGADFALMSGSGSSMFGVFTSESKAIEASVVFGEQYQTWITPPDFTGKSEIL